MLITANKTCVNFTRSQRTSVRSYPVLKWLVNLKITLAILKKWGNGTWIQ